VKRTWLAVVSSLVLGSLASAQTDSHFDLSGNVSYSGTKLVNAPSTQIDTFGWQTTGVTHLNRWLGLSSQVGSGYASSNSMQLIGYTGPGKTTHYWAMAGPRILIPLRGRVSPFVEGLVGIDRASTDLNSNGTSVTGRELQMAYGGGGGAEIYLTRRFGVNFEAQYINTQHTFAFTGWQPGQLQFSGGVVIRMLGRNPQIAEQRRSPSRVETASAPEPPSPPSSSAETMEISSPAPSTVASVQPMPAVSVSQPQPQVVVAPAETLVVRQPVTAPPVAAPAPVEQPVVSAKVAAPVPAPAPLVTRTQPAVQPTVQSQAAVPSQPVVRTQPVVQQTVAQNSFASSAPAPAPRAVARTQPQAPFSLGEYARRLREQKQREKQQQQ